VAPSGCPPAEHLDACIAYLEERGYRVSLGRHLYDRHHYLAGRDADRAADLMEAFLDPGVRAIFCARGGYGSGRLLDRLDYGRIAAHPKIVVGFSDTTALHLALYGRAGLVGFTGALASMDLRTDHRDPFTEASLWRAVTSTDPLGRVPADAASVQVLRPGRAAGPLVGGCLSLLCSLLGTPYQPPLQGAVLLLEDVSEYPYRLDRMLNQLRLAGILSQAAGLVLGQFKDCFTPEEMEHSPPLEEMVLDLTEGLDIPVLAHFPYGHFARRLVLPLGVQAILDTDRPGLSLDEPALLPG
jgi:muramoyltetrapeptide carboxypeptidase